MISRFFASVLSAAAILRHTFGLLDPPISCLVSFIGTDKIYRLLSTCNKAAAIAAVGDQDWKLAGKSGQYAEPKEKS